MKITKKRLQEIVLEEMRESQRFGTAHPDDPMGDARRPEDDAPKLDKTVARAGSQEAGQKGRSGLEREVAAMTPVEGSIEARLQAIHDELIDPGEIAGASRIRQLLDNVIKMLAAARGGGR